MKDYNPYSLEGKKILITGASSGIGKATAIECSKLGAIVIVTGRNEVRLRETYHSLSGVGHFMYIANLADEMEVESLAMSLPELDGVFFCAGITDTTLVKFVKKERIEEVLNINLISPTMLTKYLLSKKKIRKAASLVYMSSYGAEKVTLGLGIYAASKLGLNAMVHAIAKELVSRKIRANSIMPMMVKTELVDNITSISKEELRKDEGNYPLGYGEPLDVALAAIYLLSDASKWITGSQIKMDGGSTL